MVLSYYVKTQSFTLKEYPAELSLTALICLMGTLEGTAVSLVTVRDLSAWKIGFDSNLFAAAYSVSIYKLVLNNLLMKLIN